MRTKSIRPGLTTLALAAVLFAGTVPAATTSSARDTASAAGAVRPDGIQPAATTVHGCPAGWVCFYPGQNWNNDHPTLKWYYYGYYNLSNVLGFHYLYDNQTGGAWDFECSGYNGTGSVLSAGPGGTWADIDFTPVNSVKLAPAGSYSILKCG